MSAYIWECHNIHTGNRNFQTKNFWTTLVPAVSHKLTVSRKQPLKFLICIWNIG